MNQYSETRKIPRLLKTAEPTEASFRVLNGMVELEIDGERTMVPTAEAFNRLLKRIAVLEQRIGNTDNKLSQVRRSKE
jgi:hypothetical protein